MAFIRITERDRAQLINVDHVISLEYQSASGDGGPVLVLATVGGGAVRLEGEAARDLAGVLSLETLEDDGCVIRMGERLRMA